VTEAEWLACTYAAPLLEFLRGKASDRKFRLFAVACCRRLGEDRLSFYLETEQALLVAERFADGLASEEERASAAALAEQAVTAEVNAVGRAGTEMAVASAVASDIAAAAPAAASLALQAGHDHGLYRHDDMAEQGRRQVRLVREIFGNPFRPVTLDPAWLAWDGGTVAKLAQAIYDERAFDRLPVLADALEEAGCDSEGLIQHCRAEGEHFRGCWAVDRLLGKG
jgi:hypothetical protein